MTISVRQQSPITSSYLVWGNLTEKKKSKHVPMNLRRKKILKKKKERENLKGKKKYTATTFTGIPLPLPPPQNQGYLDLVYINSQASFQNTAQAFELD